MTTQISRDPFARETLVRYQATVPARLDGSGCDWCGNWRHYRGKPLIGRLFKFGTQRDDRGGTNWHQGEFCSKSCHDSYHG